MSKRKRSDMTPAQLEREMARDERRRLQAKEERARALTLQQSPEARRRIHSAIGGSYKPTAGPAPITLPKVSILEIRDWEIESK